jgi:hypothetical protein
VPSAPGIAITTSSGGGRLENRGEVVRRAVHLDAVEAHALLARIVVAEADRRHPQRAVGKHLAHDHRAGVARTDDEYLTSTREQRAAPLEDRARNGADADGAEQQQQEPDRKDAARRGGGDGREEVGVERDDHQGDHRGAQQQADVTQRDVAPPAGVEPVGDEDRHGQDDDPRQRRPEQRVRPDRHHIEAQLEREPPGDRRHGGIRRHMTHAMPGREAHISDHYRWLGTGPGHLWTGTAPT